MKNDCCTKICVAAFLETYEYVDIHQLVLERNIPIRDPIIFFNGQSFI